MGVSLPASPSTASYHAVQIQRYFWKLDEMEKRKSALALPPVAITNRCARTFSRLLCSLGCGWRMLSVFAPHYASHCSGGQ